MAIRRTIYILILIATFLMYVFHTEYLSWMLFIVVVFVPMASCFLTLPFLSRYEIRLRWNVDRIGEDEYPILSIHTGQKYPISGLRVRVSLKNLYQDEQDFRYIRMRAGQKSIPALRYQDGTYGVIRAQAEKARLQDFLGLFLLPVHCGDPVEILILPPVIPFDGGSLQLKALSQTEIQDLQTAKLRGAGDREQKDIREYREGDPMRDVHWKLSVRQDDLVVREFEPDGNQAAGIWLEPAMDKKGYRRSIGRFMGLTDFLQNQGQSYYMVTGDTVGDLVKDHEEQYALLRRLLSTPPKAEEEEQEDEPPVESGHRLLFTVTPTDVTLYVDGVAREVFT